MRHVKRRCMFGPEIAQIERARPHKRRQDEHIREDPAELFAAQQHICHGGRRTQHRAELPADLAGAVDGVERIHDRIDLQHPLHCEHGKHHHHKRCADLDDRQIARLILHIDFVVLPMFFILYRHTLIQRARRVQNSRQRAKRRRLTAQNPRTERANLHSVLPGERDLVFGKAALRTCHNTDALIPSGA